MLHISQMTLFETSILLADGAGIAAFGMALLALLWWRPEIKTPGPFFLIWTMAWLFEYYFLGKNSYIHMDDEGNFYIPYYLNIINNHLGGEFGHQFAGGNDVYTGFSPSIQLVSPELVWLANFPIWIAVLLHKAIVVSVGFWGAYFLCCKTLKTEVFTSVALAALFFIRFRAAQLFPFEPPFASCFSAARRTSQSCLPCCRSGASVGTSCGISDSLAATLQFIHLISRVAA